MFEPLFFFLFKFLLLAPKVMLTYCNIFLLLCVGIILICFDFHLFLFNFYNNFRDVGQTGGYYFLSCGKKPHICSGEFYDF